MPKLTPAFLATAILELSGSAITDVQKRVNAGLNARRTAEEKEQQRRLMPKKASAHQSTPAAKKARGQARAKNRKAAGNAKQNVKTKKA